MWRIASGAASALLVSFAAQAQTKIPPPPKDFVSAASQSDQYEIQAARVAIAQSRDPRIVSFAKMMTKDHERLSVDLRRGAQASHLPPPDPGMSSDQARMLASLQSLRGSDFDKAYLRQQVLAHAQAFAVEKSFADAGEDAKLRKAAQSALPVIEEHAKTAQQLATELGAQP